MKDLANGTAVITGGATGIGLALAIELAREGMNTVLASTNEGRLEDAASAVRAIGGAVTTVVCDVSDRAAVERLSERAFAISGTVDLLCANAGVSTTGPYLDHRPLDWDWVYDVVIKGTANCIQTFYPHMVRRGRGHILITGSQAGLVPDWVADHGPYTSAKAAVMSLGAALRPEAAQHGVGVSVLIPGGVITDIKLAERSRPERYGSPLKVNARTRVGQGARGDGMDLRRLEPSDVAQQAVAGIRTNAAWIATHPEYRSLTADYFDQILAAY